MISFLTQEWMKLRGWRCSNFFGHLFHCKKDGGRPFTVYTFAFLHDFHDIATATILENDKFFHIRPASPVEKFPNFLINFSGDFEYAVILQFVQRTDAFTTCSGDKQEIIVELKQNNIVKVPKKEILAALEIDEPLDVL